MFVKLSPKNSNYFSKMPSKNSINHKHFNNSFCESNPSNRKKVIILGSGPNRIGQGIEFDYTCVHSAFAFKENNIEAIMVNCSPETVSTDYDTSDRLYFEPLTAEDTIELIQKEMTNGELLGVNVQFGGQTPLSLAKFLQDENIPIIGTSPDMIDLAEDRDRFKKLIQKLHHIRLNILTNNFHRK